MLRHSNNTNVCSYTELIKLTDILSTFKNNVFDLSKVEANMPMQYYTESIHKKMRDYLDSRRSLIWSTLETELEVIPIYINIEIKLEDGSTCSWLEHCSRYERIGKSLHLEQAFHYIVFRDILSKGEALKKYKETYMSLKKSRYPQLNLGIPATSPQSLKKSPKSPKRINSDKKNEIMDISKFTTPQINSSVFKEKVKPDVEKRVNTTKEQLYINLIDDDDDDDNDDDNENPNTSLNEDGDLKRSSSEFPNLSKNANIFNQQLTVQDAIDRIHKELVDTSVNYSSTREVDEIIESYKTLSKKDQLYIYMTVAQELYTRKISSNSSPIINEQTDMINLENEKEQNDISRHDNAEHITHKSLVRSIEESISISATPAAVTADDDGDDDAVTPITPSTPYTHELPLNIDLNIIKQESISPIVPFEIRYKRLLNQAYTILDPYEVPDSQNNNDSNAVSSDIVTQSKIKAYQCPLPPQEEKEHRSVDNINLDFPEIDFTTPPQQPSSPSSLDTLMEESLEISKLSEVNIPIVKPIETVPISDELSSAIQFPNVDETEQVVALRSESVGFKRTGQFNTPKPKKPFLTLQSKESFTDQVEIHPIPTQNVHVKPSIGQLKPALGINPIWNQIADTAVKRSSYSLPTRKVLNYSTHYHKSDKK